MELGVDISMNKKQRNRRENDISLLRGLCLLVHVRPNEILKRSLLGGVIIVMLFSLYLVQESAFAQTGYYSPQIVAQQGTNSHQLIEGTAVSSDGSVRATITSTPIEADQSLALQIKFTDSNGNLIPYENYGIRAQQMEGNGVLIISNETAVAVTGTDIQVTDPLQNVSPVNFQIQLYGAGPPDISSAEWKGPNEILSITLGAKYSARIAVSDAPKGTNQVVTIPYGAYDPNYNTAAPMWYEPSVITIGVNQNVTWINQDKEVHTVTSGHSVGRAGLLGNGVGQPDGLFDSGTIPIGGSWTQKFTRSGTFEYFCEIHPWMQGYVIVQPAALVPTDAFGNQIMKFPVVRFTPDRAYELDLDWEPHYITTGQQIIFIYQIYDNIQNEAIPAHYIFTITQGGQQLYHIEESTQFGGAYQYFTFSNPGPVTFDFSDIAHSGQDVQFTTIVKPGNGTNSDMNMPMVEPARNSDVNFWLMPLFFVPAAVAVAAVYTIKHVRRKKYVGYRPVAAKTDTTLKKSPI